MSRDRPLQSIIFRLQSLVLVFGEVFISESPSFWSLCRNPCFAQVRPEKLQWKPKIFVLVSTVIINLSTTPLKFEMDTQNSHI